MPRTVQDYAGAVPIGRVEEPDFLRRIADVNIRSVECRGDQVVATMLWNQYVHPMCFALLPQDVLLWGGDLPLEEATLEHWASEAVSDFVYGAELPLLSSRRTSNGHVIEVTEAEPIDLRYVGGHVTGAAGPSKWREISQYADPRVPPPVVEQWRSDGDLVSWHYVSLNHEHVLPVFGHGATRWVSEGVASFDYLNLSPGLPDTFGVLTIADAIHRAAAQGAHTIISTIEVPGIELLGFRNDDGALKIDNRFLDIDYDALADFVSETAGWTPPVYVQSAITCANNATYYAG